MSTMLSASMRRMIAAVVAAIALVSAATEIRAQTPDPILPPLSVHDAQYFKNNPEAWSQFLAQLPRRPAGPPQAAPQSASAAFGGTWTAVTTAPSVGLSNPLLLTDGTVIVHVAVSQTWYKLTPDINGSYANGTWSQIASLPSGYGPEYFASAVLPDGRVIIEGGEFNMACSTTVPIWTNLGAIYDPVANTWTSVSPPSGTGWTNTDACGSGVANGGIGNAAAIVRSNGTFVLSGCCSNPAVDALFNATTLTYSSTGAPVDTCVPCGGGTYQDGQSYTMLPYSNLDGFLNVLTVDAYDSPNAEWYEANGDWQKIAAPPVSLVDPCGHYVVGPAVTRPGYPIEATGTTVAFGANTGCTGTSADANPTAIYTAETNGWVEGPSVPQVNGQYYNLTYAPAAWLPNGNILFGASPGFASTPTHFFEFTSAASSPANAINQVADPIYFSTTQSAYNYNFLNLPNGQIFMTDQSNTPEVYTPTGSAPSNWQPTITLGPSCVRPGESLEIIGTQFNGLSQGAATANNAQGATNYPLVMIQNKNTGHVFYARTTNPTTMAIQAFQAGTVDYQVASATELGASTLYVIANGVPSAAATMVVSNACPPFTDSHDFNNDTRSDILWRDTSGDLAIWEMDGGTILNPSNSGLGSVSTTWSIVGQRDFNGDTAADILWRDTSGNLAIWEMSGTTILNPSNSGLGSVPTNWSIVGTGDFNGDGKADILWRDTAGDLAIWEMNGTTIINPSSSGVGTVPTNWTVVGVGDFNGDGKADILWQNNTNGNLAIYLMNGTTVTSSATFANLGAYSVVGIGDFNGDGKSDILLRDGSGDIEILEMNGTTILNPTSSSVGNLSTVWSVAETGDFNGDGYSDILWRDTSGDVAIWYMNGTTLSSGAGLGTIPTTFTIQSTNAD